MAGVTRETVKMLESVTEEFGLTGFVHDRGRHPKWVVQLPDGTTMKYAFAKTPDGGRHTVANTKSVLRREIRRRLEK